MSLPLSTDTIARIKLLFSGPELEEARRLLEEQCGNNLPFCESATPQSSERIRFAVLKLSEGDFSKFKRALEIAKQDWRDVLVAAGFANDVSLHQRWWPPSA